MKPQPSTRRPARLLLAVTLCLAGCSCRSGGPALPPPAWLPKIPEGYGQPFRSGALLRVHERRLVLPTGQACLGGESACAKALSELKGQDLVLELDETLRMADLSAALAALGEALEPGEQVCLSVFDGKARRCLPFRPFSGDDFGAWLDADKPLGKIRIVMRTDGLEVVTDRGKIPGPDRYGPSLPSPGAVPDYAGVDDAARKLDARFPDEDTAGLVPSASIPVAQAARVLSMLSGPQGERFEKTFLVYP